MSTCTKPKDRKEARRRTGSAGAGRPAADRTVPTERDGCPGRAVVAALMVSVALVALDGTIVATAVPQIVGDLGGFSLFSWLFAGYLLSFTVVLPVCGKLSDTFGRKPVLLVGMGLFLASSLLCAAAWSMAALIAFRILQGLGGGAIEDTVRTLTADLYPLKDRPKIQARMATVWATASIAGPAFGGLLAGYADWRWIFLINIPLGALALALVVRHLRDTDQVAAVARTRAAVARIDWPGALAVFACGGLLLFALVQGGVAWPWTSVPSLLMFGSSALLAGVVVYVERRAADPILPGWVWRRRTIASVNVAMAALGLLMVAPMVFLPTYAQSALGLGPVGAGFVMSAMTLSWPISSALSQHVYRRIGFRNSAVLGIGAAFLCLAAFPLLPHPAQPWQPALLMFGLGAALGLFQTPLVVGVQSTVRWAERGVTTASLLSCRQVGQSVGCALFGAIASATIGSRLVGATEPGMPTHLDDVARALDHPSLTDAAAEHLRTAVTTAVDHVYVGAAAAALAALLVLLLVAPRTFPVLQER
ncbi:MDR family MFS transporter [Streptomyces lavendulae]|uniref:MDR family MFS transporter n=1 Tax=Streptomyces lavendulae TaxID=1914 RepID=UPI0036C31ED9